MQALAAILGLTLTLATTAAEQDSVQSSAARFLEGELPATSLLALDGGLVVLVLLVSSTGEVEEILEITSTPPFTDLVGEQVAQWRFEPAVDNERPVPSQVLVAALFRRPVLLGRGPEAARDLHRGQGPPQAPYPLSIETPPYPPLALQNGVVLVEVEVGRSGSVEKAEILRSAPGFDEVSLESAAKWLFRPARREGRAVDSVAYLIFGFRQPVTDSIEAVPVRKKPRY